MAFFTDGKTLASTSADTTLKFWDVDSGQEKASFTAHPSGAEALAISPGGQTVATGGWGGLVKLWDATKEKERATLQGHTLGVPSVAFSPDGKLLASCSGYWDQPRSAGEVKIWGVNTGRELLTLPTGPTDLIWSVCFSPDGKTLAMASRDQTLRLWEVATWQERLVLPVDSQGVVGLSSKQLDALWDDLAGPDASKAYRALCLLVRTAPQAVALARERLRPVVSPDAQEVRTAPSGNSLQALRAVELLEHIGSREARQVLERLAKGAPEARLTREAKASLERLALRPLGTQKELTALRQQRSVPSAVEKSFIPLDLQAKTNHKRTDSFQRGRYPGNTLASLPAGKQTLHGIPFQIGEGVIQLGSTLLPDKPAKVTGIPVHKKFSRLQILHATGFFLSEHDTSIGSYTVHYEDGTTATIPVVYGRDVVDWWKYPASPEPTRGKVAWEGVNEAAQRFGAILQLYVATWVNPQPTKTVRSIDYASTMDTDCAPFCVAITLEEP